MNRNTPSRIRHALALMVCFALVNVITVCPVLAHPESAEHACCPHSAAGSMPCTDTTPKNCPYVLLEKSVARVGLLSMLVAPAAHGQSAGIGAFPWSYSPGSRSWRADGSDTYLRVRVLLV